MITRTGEVVFSLMLLFAPLGCGGSGSEPTTPAEEPRASEAAPKGEEPPAAEPAAEEAEPEAKEPAAEEPKERLRSPKDVISSEGVMFTFSFRQSEVYEKAKARCDEKSGDDPAKAAACMTKEHDKFDADSIAFRKDDDGVWTWLTIRRRGTSLAALHKIEFEWGDETKTTITIKPKGRDTGSKPMGRIPKELVIEVPDDAGIILTDPTHGRMVYEAKMGLMGEAAR